MSYYGAVCFQDFVEDYDWTPAEPVPPTPAFSSLETPMLSFEDVCGSDCQPASFPGVWEPLVLEREPDVPKREPLVPEPAVSKSEKLAVSKSEPVVLKSEKPAIPKSERRPLPKSERLTFPKFERLAFPISERHPLPISERPPLPKSERLVVSKSERRPLPKSERLAVSKSERRPLTKSERLAVSKSERPVREHKSVFERLGQKPTEKRCDSRSAFPKPDTRGLTVVQMLILGDRTLERLASEDERSRSEDGRRKRYRSEEERVERSRPASEDGPPKRPSERSRMLHEWRHEGDVLVLHPDPEEYREFRLKECSELEKLEMSQTLAKNANFFYIVDYC